jgi:hypothetical protein
VSCLLIAAALSASVIPASSEATTIRGAGASTCSDYVRVYDAFRLSTDGDVSRRATANFLQYEEWIDGATGIKWTLGNGPRTICQEHRSDIVANAALALFREMRGPSF